MARNTSGPVQQYGGTTAQHGNYVGAPREITVDTTKNTAVVHDGITISGFPLAREDRQILAGDSIIKVEGPGDLSGDTTIKLDPDKVAEWNLKEATYVDTIPTDETQFKEFISGLDEGAIVVETSGSGYVQNGPVGMPVGSVIAFAGNINPAGFLLCDGAAVSRTDYKDLFDAVGTLYGVGDGNTTFNLPNLTDRFIQGSNTSGTVMEAGLPGITGQFGWDGNNVNQLDKFAGSLFGDYISTGTPNARGSVSADGSYLVQLDASRSNPIYGNSSTVQPPAVTMRYYIKF